MANPCHGICKRPEYKVEKPAIRQKGEKPYSVEKGVKYCSTCCLYMQTNNEYNNCPCCTSKLRVAARNSKSRRMNKSEWMAKAVSWLNNMPCRGICYYTQYRASQRSGEGRGEPPTRKQLGVGPYSIGGVRYCAYCSVYFNTGNKFNRCPCCNMLMRSTARLKRKNKSIQHQQQKEWGGIRAVAIWKFIVC